MDAKAIKKKKKIHTFQIFRRMDIGTQNKEINILQ